MASTDLPPLAAIFVTAFHKTEGYKIIFARSHEVNLEGCEYKTLPSGIEKVENDVVYFAHGERGQYIGLAVYRNLQSPGTERKEISCCSIAVLVQAESHNLRHQRLNKVWLYNTPLRHLANAFDAQSEAFFDDVEALFDSHKNTRKQLDSVRLNSRSPPASPVLSRFSSFKNYSSFRSERQASQTKNTSLLPSHELSNLHPVLSLHDLISFFGPLIFPLFRAALARKRILIVSTAPVQRACHFIYNIQLLSAIPNSATTMRRPNPLRQLFCLGLNDIPLLERLGEEDADSRGWIGVTTDRILMTKTHLFDYLIVLPEELATTSLAVERARPVVTRSDGSPIQPSYLDGLNFHKLKPCLPLYRDTGLKARPQISWKRSIVDSVLSGFLYWASAGQSLDFEDSEIYLEARDESSSPSSPKPPRSTQGKLTITTKSPSLHSRDASPALDSGHNSDAEDSPLLRSTRSRLADPHSTFPSPPISNGRDEVLTLVLFHRLTSTILSTLDDLCCETTDQADDLKVTRQQMVALGFTPRLQTDVDFMVSIADRWFSRSAVVDTSFWPCC